MKKILFIGGSMNQTTMLHKIAKELPDYDNYFTPYYCDGIERFAKNMGLLDFTIMGGKFKRATEKYLAEHNLKLDYEGTQNNYELVVMCSDLIVPKNIRGKKIVLVQEGMTDPENFAFHLVKKINIPRYFASTSATGLSDMYSIFCVASQGYKDHFIKKGTSPEKIVVTGIPNYDDCESYLQNNFPHKNYVLVCTSDLRETYKCDNRKKFINECLKISNGRQLIFKLHPNEVVLRAKREIEKYAPGALVYHTANTNEMIANCDVLITKYSTVVYVGIVLGKEVHSSFNLDELKKLVPLQNNGRSAILIARLCRELIESFTDRLDLSHIILNDKINKEYPTAG